MPLYLHPLLKRPAGLLISLLLVAQKSTPYVCSLRSGEPFVVADALSGGLIIRSVGNFWSSLDDGLPLAATVHRR